MVQTPQKYLVRSTKKRPDMVEAMRFDGSNVEAMTVYQWVEQNTAGSFDVNSPIDPIPQSGCSIDAATGKMVIATPEGIRYVRLGDWVVKLVNSEFAVMSNDTFHSVYVKA